MTRRRARQAEADPALLRVAALLGELHPVWADSFSRNDLVSMPQPDLLQLWSYLSRLQHNLSLFVPARDPDYGISERGGDAILGYLRNRNSAGSYLFFADVSGFTALLTFLTDRFGKEEAGDIMNLGILNRFCLNKMGLILEHFRDEYSGGDRGVAALKVMLAIRASMPRVTLEVRDELQRKLAGKPRQNEIGRFIDNLVVKASGGVVFEQNPGTGFYGSRIKARITWGQAGTRVALAEKLGGNEQQVRPDEPEVKGIGIDRVCRARLDDLLSEGWLGLEPGDLAVSELSDGFCKLVIRASGMGKLEGFVAEVCSAKIPEPGEAPRELRTMDAGGLAVMVESLAGQVAAVEPYLTSGGMTEYLVRRLGKKARRNILLDEACSSVRDSGVLFCNFSLRDTSMLDELSDEIHGVMNRFGIHYKYNIFPRGHFNMMGVLGTEFSHRVGGEMYFAEVLWNAWRDLHGRLGHKFGAEVEIRGGMSVGKALQGPAGDNIVNNEETIIGPDCNLAARLVNEALETGSEGAFVHPSGTLFTVDSQRRKLEHLVHPEPPVRKAELKGFSSSVPLYALHERRDLETVAEFIARLRRYPLVTSEGRVVRTERDMRADSRLGRMMGVLERAAAEGSSGKPALVSLVASSGVGKTRRIAEVAGWAQKKGWPVWFGECYSWYQGDRPDTGEMERDSAVAESHSDEGAYPFFPFIKILKEQVFGLGGGETEQEIAHRIEGSLAALDVEGASPVAQAPVVASFLGLKIPETAFSQALDAEQRRNLFYQSVANIFRAAADQAQRRGGAALLCIDDLQWADRNSLHLLSFIIRHAGGGLVVALNARRHAQLGVLRDKSLPVERHEFRPGLLKPKAVKILAALVLGIDQDSADGELPPEMSHRVEHELESNPFFIIEFCSKLLDQELITVADGRCTRFDAEKFDTVTIPNKIQGVIEERIAMLSSDEHAAIRYSSVLGNILRYIIIRRFLPQADQAGRFAGRDLEEVFSHLTGKEITRLENEKDPDWVYTFKRALIGEKLYQELVPTLRKRLHSQVAATFEDTELANGFEKALLTALHYSHAEIPDKAATFYLEAGKLARGIFDNEKSLMLFGRAGKLLDEYRVTDADSKWTVLHEQRGQVNLLLGRYQDALEDFGKLAALAEKQGDSEKSVMALYLQGQTLFQRSLPGDFSAAAEFFSCAEKKLGEENSHLLAEILNDHSRALMELGATEKAITVLDRAEQVFRQGVEGGMDWKARLFLATLLRNRGSVAARRGRMDEAVETYDFALSMVDDESEERYRRIRAQLYNSRGLALSRGFKLEEALLWFGRALELASSIGDIKTEIMVRINMAVVDNDSGRNARALETLSTEHDRLEMLVGPTRELAALKFNIGECYMFMEKPGQAEPWYRQALDIGKRIGYIEFVVATSYNLAELLNTFGRDEEALAVLLPADKLASEGGWSMQRMDIDNLLGEIYRGRENYARARSFHDSALELSAQLDDTFGRSWALRNVALDVLANPRSNVGELEGCRTILEESLEAARTAGQPENLMHSLRALLEWTIKYNPDELAGVRPLYDELLETAEKVDSRVFGDFCRAVSAQFLQNK